MIVDAHVLGFLLESFLQPISGAPRVRPVALNERKPLFSPFCGSFLIALSTTTAERVATNSLDTIEQTYRQPFGFSQSQLLHRILESSP